MESVQVPVYTVLDVQYRLAPEHPFPAALNDVEDAINWVLQQPDKFDLTQVAISGFSAGGSLAICGIFRALPTRDIPICPRILVYPPLDLYTDPAAESPPDPAGKPIPALLSRLFNKCYVPSTYDARDPRISPCYAQPELFPDRVLIVIAAGDTLAGEAEALAAKIEKLPGRQVVCRRMQGCDDAWDKSAVPGIIQGDAKAKAYAMAVEMLIR